MDYEEEQQMYAQDEERKIQVMCYSTIFDMLEDEFEYGLGTMEMEPYCVWESINDVVDAYKEYRKTGICRYERPEVCPVYNMPLDEITSGDKIAGYVALSHFVDGELVYTMSEVDSGVLDSNQLIHFKKCYDDYILELRKTNTIADLYAVYGSSNCPYVPSNKICKLHNK